jgi:hypothetical protein
MVPHRLKTIGTSTVEICEGRRAVVTVRRLCERLRNSLAYGLIRHGADGSRELKRVTASNKEHLVPIGLILAGRMWQKDVPPAASPALHLIAGLEKRWARDRRGHGDPNRVEALSRLTVGTADAGPRAIAVRPWEIGMRFAHPPVAVACETPHEGRPTDESAVRKIVSRICRR